MHRVYLSIGGNLGNKRKNFKNVYSLIGERLGTIMERSSLFETSPWGFESDDNFWNQVLLVETPLGPEVLLAGIRETEGFFHRQREPGRYLSREMDIDMLYFDDIVMDSETLKIPHPLMHQRLFVLVPLTEIAPDMRHPLLGKTSRELLSDCQDDSEIRKTMF